ncbi:photosystem II reaction center W protein, chloroplastic-like [Dioscorea cayenensis subsp. rotundata]|uniref:PSII 6.1 kDa protein n=1 Tax=Dioscorea cayennensis subsp. rotundata TaxID=55577 RepID=A0AB40AX58_DIOCR|nr:photosystem II reaction center W protein, chloroplastic-like [Dioscorea cayenensis subsp. rotundata]
MATTLTTPTSIVTRTAAWAVATPKAAPVLGLGQMKMRGGRVRCSSETKTTGPTMGMGAALLAAAGVMSVSNPVLALVDERLSTEGTGLSLGLSNNFLGWILLGVFGLIWSLYFLYTSTLEEDEESGLSL